MKTNTIPAGYHTVTPYLIVAGAAELIKFIKQVFEGEEIQRTERSDGSIQHARVRIGDSVIMMGEPIDGIAPMPAMLYLYVSDPDTLYQRAIEAGAASLSKPADQYYGDRNAGVQDPFGNKWWIAARKEDVSAEELERRAKTTR